MILEDIPKSCPAYEEELFGPVFNFFRYREEDQAIEIANDTIYGLGGGIFTKNIERGIELARRIESGNVFINDIT